MHNLYHCDLSYVSSIPDPELALKYFIKCFNFIANKHAPYKKMVKDRSNHWFSRELSDLLYKRNMAWAKARKTDSTSDWLSFRQLRNRGLAMTRKAKSDFSCHLYLIVVGILQNFGKHECMKQNSVPSIPQQIISTTGSVTDKKGYL